MRIQRLLWPEERIDHIARHGVTPEEVEEACFGKPFVRRSRSEGENPVYPWTNHRRAISVLRGDCLSRRQWFSGNRAAYDGAGKEALPTMERPMKKSKLPKTDSIQKLAEFWDSHDLTDFEDELETVDGPVFKREENARKQLENIAKALRNRDALRVLAEGHSVQGRQNATISVPLAARDARAIGRLAQSKGVSPEDLIRTWVIQNIRATQKNPRTNSGTKRPSAA